MDIFLSSKTRITKKGKEPTERAWRLEFLASTPLLSLYDPEAAIKGDRSSRTGMTKVVLMGKAVKNPAIQGNLIFQEKSGI